MMITEQLYNHYMKQTYKVIAGVMAGTTFNGEVVRIGGEARVWNNDSIGQSYPLANCVVVSEEQNAL